jgi:hypothetical protein
MPLSGQCPFLSGMYYQILIKEHISGGKVATGKAEHLAFLTFPT